MSSACCSAVDRPAFDGQSMLPTVATHTARSSRATGGGADCARAEAAAPARISRAARRVTRDDMREGGRCGGGTCRRTNDAWRRSGATFVLYSDRHHSILPHRGQPEDASVDAQIARLAPLPAEVARHRLAHHLLPRFRVAVLIDGAHRTAHE